MAKLKDPEDALFWYEVRDAYHMVVSDSSTVVEFDRMGRKCIVKHFSDKEYITIRVYPTVEVKPTPLIVP